MSSRRSRRTTVWVLVALCAAAVAGVGSSGGAEPGAEKRPLRILFLGNSLTATNDLPGVVAALGRATGVPVEPETIAPGGFSLEDHWANGSRERVAAGGWDAVVMQQGPSSLPESRTHLRHWAEVVADEARAHGARPAVFTVWPESSRSYAFPAVLASYRAAARGARATLLPAGDAWRAAWRREPRLRLYGPDGFHPSRLGTYLAAAVVFSGLTGVPPARLPRSLELPGGRLTTSVRTARILRAAVAEALARR